MALKSSNAQNSKHTMIVDVDWGTYDKYVRELAAQIHLQNLDLEYVTGVPRGGLGLAVHLSNLLKIEFLAFEDIAAVKHAHQLLVCDDVSDTGVTLQGFVNRGCITATLFVKPQSIAMPTFHAAVVPDEAWINFPWEK